MHSDVKSTKFRPNCALSHPSAKHGKEYHSLLREKNDNRLTASCQKDKNLHTQPLIPPPLGRNYICPHQQNYSNQCGRSNLALSLTEITNMYIKKTHICQTICPNFIQP